MQKSRYDYQLCQITTMPLPERLAFACGKKVIEVLYHPDAPFNVRELCDDILPALGKQYRADAGYFQTPVRLSLTYAPREQDYVALLTFHCPFHEVTLEHMKVLKKVIASLAKALPCEVTFESRLP